MGGKNRGIKMNEGLKRDGYRCNRDVIGLCIEAKVDVTLLVT